MIRRIIFNQINAALTVDAFKNVFQRRSIEVLLPDILELETIQNRSICFIVNGVCMLVGLLQIVDKKSV